MSKFTSPALLAARCKSIHESVVFFKEQSERHRAGSEQYLACIDHVRNGTEALHATIDHLAALVPSWKPISEIPAKGHFLVYMPEEPRTPIQVAVWRPNVKTIGGVFSFERKPVTHFQVLPPIPGGK